MKSIFPKALMNPNEHIIRPTDLEAGDILLCVGEGDLAAEVTTITHSNYTHAAICYSASEVTDISNCVERTPICDFINGFKYVAAFRVPDCWDTMRRNSMQHFIDEKVAANIKYDTKAAMSLMRRQKAHRSQLFEKLTEHFTNGLPPEAHDKTKYICSELVIASLIAAGIWDGAMAIAYQGNTIHPGSMGHDPTFGYLVGFLRAHHTTEIPCDDEFACSPTNQMTIAEWNEARKQILGESAQPDQILTPQEMKWLLQTD
jgi:hypothetical protein